MELNDIIAKNNGHDDGRVNPQAYYQQRPPRNWKVVKQHSIPVEEASSSSAVLNALVVLFVTAIVFVIHRYYWYSSRDDVEIVSADLTRQRREQGLLKRLEATAAVAAAAENGASSKKKASPSPSSITSKIKSSLGSSKIKKPKSDSKNQPNKQAAPTAGTKESLALSMPSKKSSAIKQGKDGPNPESGAMSSKSSGGNPAENSRIIVKPPSCHTVCDTLRNAQYLADGEDFYGCVAQICAYLADKNWKELSDEEQEHWAQVHKMLLRRMAGAGVGIGEAMYGRRLQGGVLPSFWLSFQESPSEAINNLRVNRLPDRDLQISVMRNCLMRQKRLLGKRHILNARSHERLARSLWNQGDYEDALSHYHEALETRQWANGAVCGEVAYLHGQKARFQRLDCGNFDEAIRSARSAIEIYTKLPPMSLVKKPDQWEDDFKLCTVIQAIAQTREGMAFAMGHRGDTKGAIREFRRCLDTEETIVRKARIFGRIGEAYRCLGDYNNAILNHREAVLLFEGTEGEAIKGREQEAPARAHELLAYTLFDSGDEDGGIIEFHKAANFRKYSSKPVVQRYYDDGVFWFSKEEFRKATEEFQKCLHIREKVLGFDDPATCQSSFRLSYSLTRERIQYAALEVAQGFILRTISSMDPTTAEKPDYLGVSVHHLQTTFMRDALGAGFTSDSTIYDIEDLNNPGGGLIRQKSKACTCPLDGEAGAAYVHSLEGADNVGNSTHMLSYTWGYKIGDIVSVLVDYCARYNLDPKRTYFWICCLSVNQHRVAKKASTGLSVSTQAFFDTFHDRVKSIGRIVCMMAPWSKPAYLTRVWCIFEMATAFSDPNCTVDVVMPPKEKASLAASFLREPGRRSVLGVEALFLSWSSIRVQNAKASKENDRRHILEWIERHGGGFKKINKQVQRHLRGWMQSVLMDMVADAKAMTAKQGGSTTDSVGYASVIFVLGCLLSEIGDSSEAVTILKAALELRIDLLGADHIETKSVHRSLAISFARLGRYKESNFHFDASQDAQPAQPNFNAKSTYTRPPTTVQLPLISVGESFVKAKASYEKGVALYENLDLDGALAELRMCLLFKPDLQKPSSEIDLFLGEAHARIGCVLLDMHVPIRSTAHFQKALYLLKASQRNGKLTDANKERAKQLQELVARHLGLEEHLSASESLDYQLLKRRTKIDTLIRTHKLENARMELEACIARQEIVLGPSDKSIAETSNKLGNVLLTQGRFKAALESYERSLAVIEECDGGHRNEDAITAFMGIGQALHNQLEYEPALAAFQKAFKASNDLFGSDGLKGNEILNQIGLVQKDQGRFEEAAMNLRQSILLYTKHKANDTTVAERHFWIGEALEAMGDLNESLNEFETALRLLQENSYTGPLEMEVIEAISRVTYLVSLNS